MTPTRPSLDQALLALRDQRAGDAERLAAGVLKADRGNVLAAQVLGQALLLQGRPQAAIDPLRRAAGREPDAETETLLARALAGAGREAEALDQLQRATTRRPAFPLAFLELGERLGDLRRFDEGLAVFEAGLTLLPDAIILSMGLGYLHLKRNDRAAARARFLRVRAAAPERYDAMVALARVMALDGDHADAADLYRHALALRPDDALTRISLGKCLLEMGAREAGEATLRAALKSDPRLAAQAIAALAATPHGRLFLRPADAATFLAP